MKITLNTQRFAQELRLLSKVAPVKPVLPVLANALFYASAESLTLYATDLEVGIFAPCDALIHAPGTATLPAKRLLDIVEQLPDTDVTITLDSHDKAHIVCGHFHSCLQTIPAIEYPQLPAVEGDVATLSAATLRELLERTRYAISDTDKRFILGGAQMTLGRGVLGMVSTDGKRLSVATAPCPPEAAAAVLIPTKAMDALVPALTTGEVRFSSSAKHLFFVIGGHVFFSRTIDGQFPAYERIIPKDNEHRAEVARAPFAAALRRVGLVAETTQGVTLQISEGWMLLASNAADVGEADERFEIGYTGPEIRVVVNWRHVLDFLEAGSSATIALAAKDARSALLLTDGNFLNVIMVRL